MAARTLSHPHTCSLKVVKPLIIHTRSAADDTLQMMREEHAEKVGGVMHCFTESLEVAEAAMEMGFSSPFPALSVSRTPMH